MILGSHSFVKWTRSFKLRKDQGYKLSHKMTKNLFRALFLKTGVLQTWMILPFSFRLCDATCMFFLWNFVAMTQDMIKSTLLVSVTHFFSRGRFLEFSNSKVQLLIANIEVYQIKQVKQHRFSTTFALKYTVLVT